MKDRLYYQDSYIKQFETLIKEQGTDENGLPYVVLENTAFYPTGGGQPCDTGTLNDVRVVQVEEIDGQIRHYLEQPLPESKKEVQGILDWERRFDHMQQHAGQHILSACFHDLFDYLTVSFHMGKEIVTIDLDTKNVTKSVLAQVEERANAIVLSNQPIQTKWVEAADLELYPLRKPPKVSENIRLVMIDEIDYNACGGTHPQRTAEVGPIQILGTEKVKDKTRVSFICGLRAIHAFSKKHAILRKLSHTFNRPEDELISTINEVLEEQKRLNIELDNVKRGLIDQEAAELLEKAIHLSDGAHLVSHFFIERDLKELQQLAYSIKDQDDHAVLLLTVTNNDKLQFIAGRGQALSCNMNVCVKEVLPLIDGRGGGKPDHVQGGGAAKMTASALLEHLKKAFIGKEPVS